MSYDYFDRYAELDRDEPSALPPAMGTGDEAMAANPVDSEPDDGPCLCGSGYILGAGSDRCPRCKAWCCARPRPCAVHAVAVGAR